MPFFTGRLLGARSRPAAVIRLLVLGALALGLYLAWREFWFLTDDAFITFRYIDHHRRGWGYTWNPPPFKPVEGYSNFLWMVILEGVWALTGATPPAACNFVSLLFSYGTAALAFLMVWRAPLPERWQPQRFWLAALAVLFAVANRTFVTWTSSGLETALFSFCTAVWLFGSLELGRGGQRGALAIASTGAAAAALTRPDGQLLVIATGLLAGYGLLRDRNRRRLVQGLLPLVVVPIHLLWRHHYYGLWVPNTYYAKHVNAWPDAGIRYTESFILEYAVWAWLLVALVVAVIGCVRIEREGLPPRRIAAATPTLIIAGTLVTHVAYYALIIGGDHFEYRVYAHLIVPMAVALARLVVCLPIGPGPGMGVFLGAIALAQPIPWIHYAKTRHLDTRLSTFKMFVPVADAFPPGPWHAYARQFDLLQHWMVQRHVGTRHQEHKLFFFDQFDYYPSRVEGQKIRWNDKRPVLVIPTVGIPSWVMPEVAIIDYHGLNDRVIARTPVGTPPAVRLMAHERRPPPGYVECFRPNTSVENVQVRISQRKQPLTDKEIEACEDKFAHP